MSAFIVNDFHINCLVSWASARHGVDQVSHFWRHQHVYWHGNEARIAQLLYAENVRSVNFRYRGQQSVAGFKFRLETCGMKLSAIQVIRAAHCLDYQSCECDDWEATEAYAALKGLVDAAVRALPGYMQAAWELLDAEAA